MSDAPTAAELRAATAGANGVDDELTPRRAAKRRDRYTVTWDKDRKPPKPILPKLPDHDDVPGECAWVTSVLHLHHQHPVTGAVHQGLSGAAGHVEIARLDAPPIRFEPASKISNAQKLNEELVWQLLPIDEEPYPWSNAHATVIARVVARLCGSDKGSTTTQETAHIVSTYIDAGRPFEGHTYGTAAQRAEMALQLRPVEGPHIYGVDKDTGEYVVRVSDLQRVARDVIGSTVAYGWLDARMEALGWDRIRLEGRTLPDGPTSRGDHVRADAYRGHLDS